MSPGLAVLLIALTYVAEALVRIWYIRPHKYGMFS